LDYIYLANGYTVENDPDYGTVVSIHEEDDLLRAIGFFIAYFKKELTGPDFRFLRKQMGLTQERLTEAFGVDVQTIANYEKGKKIPVPSQNLMRHIFAIWILPPDARVSALKELADAVKQDATQRTQRAPQLDVWPPIVNFWTEGGGCHV
jgi:transcriptional regulator with XRE-family HTH domain